MQSHYNYWHSQWKKKDVRWASISKLWARLNDEWIWNNVKSGKFKNCLRFLNLIDEIFNKRFKKIEILSFESLNFCPFSFWCLYHNYFKAHKSDAWMYVSNIIYFIACSNFVMEWSQRKCFRKTKFLPHSIMINFN